MQNRALLLYGMSTIRKNTDGFSKKYYCATALYLLSMFAHAYSIIIDTSVGSTGHGSEVVDSLDVLKTSLFQC